MPGANFRGDFDKLRKLVAGMSKIQSPAFLAECSREAAKEALEQVHASFEKQSSPYGEPWKPLKSRQGQPLRDTGRLFNSFSYRSSRRGFSVFSNVKYASYHQLGTRTIPARPFLPIAARGYGNRFRLPMLAVLRAMRVRYLGR